MVAEAETPIQSAAAIDNGFDQSSPGMVVTFGLVFMLSDSTVLVVGREQGTLRRLLVMPVSRTAILTEKLGGIFAAGVFQAAVLILAGAALFSVNWRQPPLRWPLASPSPA